MGFNVYFKENINGFTYDNMVQYYVKLLTMNFDDIVEHEGLLCIKKSACHVGGGHLSPRPTFP